MPGPMHRCTARGSSDWHLRRHRPSLKDGSPELGVGPLEKGAARPSLPWLQTLSECGTRSAEHSKINRFHFHTLFTLVIAPVAREARGANSGKF